MTPLTAYLVCVFFMALLIGGAAVLENTERGRRFAERAVDWMTR